jgi:flagellar biosynthesis/type III secretory pathway ATPase
MLASLSRVMNAVVSSKHRQYAGKLREIYATYEAHRDLIALGAYEYGNDERVDLAIDVVGEIDQILQQGLEDWTPLEETIARMGDIVA